MPHGKHSVGQERIRSIAAGYRVVTACNKAVSLVQLKAVLMSYWCARFARLNLEPLNLTRLHSVKPCSWVLLRQFKRSIFPNVATEDSLMLASAHLGSSFTDARSSRSRGSWNVATSHKGGYQPGIVKRRWDQCPDCVFCTCWRVIRQRLGIYIFQLVFRVDLLSPSIGSIYENGGNIREDLLIQCSGILPIPV